MRAKSKSHSSKAVEPSARSLSAEALSMVVFKKRLLDGFFDAHVADLSSADRAHAKALIWGALRRYGAIKALLASLMEHELPDRARRAEMLLIIGVTDLLVVGAAAHGAVDQIVTLIKSYRETARYAGLANAILRRLARDLEGFQKQLHDLQEKSLPDWLLKRWQEKGWPTAVLADHLCDIPALDVTLKPEACDTREKLLQAGGEPISENSVRLNAQSPNMLPGFKEGDFWVQDIAAALAVRLMPLQKGQHVLDLCAAPGGKTLQLASYGAKVTALDRSAKRLDLVAENLARTNLTATLIAADGVEWRPANRKALFDHILLDAPCTALGTFRRNPDILAIRDAKDVEGVTRIQSDLLRHAATLLKPGGSLIFAVCSMEAEEGEDQIRNLLNSDCGLILSPIGAEEVTRHCGLGIDAERCVTRQGMVLLRPDLMDLVAAKRETGRGLRGMDGFFMARLLRPSS